MSLKVEIERTKENIQLVKALVDKDENKRLKARNIVARIIETVIDEQLPLFGSSSLVYEDFPFAEGDSLEIPVDQYANADENEVAVWSQNRAGGLGTSEVSGLETVRFSTYPIDSAVSFKDKFARSGQIQVLQNAISRMLEEVKSKQETNGWTVLLKSLAEAQNKNGTKHVIRSQAANNFDLQDFNDLLTRIARLNIAWNNGTPANGVGSVTDMFISPEVMGNIRAFSYNPINTNVATGVSVSAPEEIRREAFRSGGLQNIFGVGLVELLELGVNQDYNALFDYFANLGNYTYAEIDGSNDAAFQNLSQELIIARDGARQNTLLRPVLTDEDTSSTFTVIPDDQWYARQETTGFYGKLEEGRMVLEPKGLMGIII